MIHTNVIVDGMSDRSKKIAMDVTPKEAAVIKFIRENPFAKIHIIMKHSEVFGITVEASHMITDEDGLLFISHDQAGKPISIKI